MASRNGKRPHANGKKKPEPEKPLPEKVPQAHGGALYRGGVPGNRGGHGGGRPFSITKQLAAERLPKHVDTLDDIATGKATITIAQKCPKCGFVPDETTTEPQHVRPNERVRAIEVLTKLADSSEIIVTSENTSAFLSCIERALIEIVEPHLIPVVQERARELFKNSRKSA